jgi:hypothetical protein
MKEALDKGVLDRFSILVDVRSVRKDVADRSPPTVSWKTARHR